MGIKVQFSAECRQCNPGEPIFYDDKAERDYVLNVGFAIK